MVKVTKASCALRAAVKPKRTMTQKALSETLGCTQQAVSAWVNGVSPPDMDRRKKLEAMFQIPVTDWDVVVPPPAPSSGDLNDAEASGLQERQGDAVAANDDDAPTEPRLADSNGTEG